MSSSFNREPLSGLIRQDQRIIGAICLPEDGVQEFINQFNHCYGPMGMCIVAPNPMPAPATLVPVGATLRNPFRAPIGGRPTHTDGPS